MTREVVVTGLGVVSPFGAGVEILDTALLAGHSNTAPIEVFDAAGYRVRVAQTVRRELRGPGDPAVAFADTSRGRGSVAGAARRHRS